MEAIYAKLYNKYTKLKKEKDSEMEKLNREQEEKFLNYVAAAEEMIEYLRSEKDKLSKQVNELKSELASTRSTKDEQLIHYQNLLMEENLKNKELSEEIERLQSLEQQRQVNNLSQDYEGENGQANDPGGVSPHAFKSPTIKKTRKRSRQSLLVNENPVDASDAEENLDDLMKEPTNGLCKMIEAPCCRRIMDASGNEVTDTEHLTCMFQDLAGCIVGMKLSPFMENEEYLISALHESSGYSFTLTWINNSSGKPELLYRVSSLGTFERIAPEWMRDVLMFSTSMCPIFFERLSRVIKA
nr:uncharacterized protein LOC109179488 isoform X1 [Ipomoea batatas]GME09248.1 uncharacterized protein LOC109179488 isoform X1 [Ipomoea batatas]